MPHSAAFAALTRRDSGIRLHFAPPPFHSYALKKLHDARVVITSSAIIGGSHSNSLFYSTTRFAEENPLVIAALRAAAQEAKGLIEKKTLEAVASYRELSNDKSEAADILEVLAEPGMMSWQTEPLGTMPFAEHLYRIGEIKRKPESWRDYFLPTSHDMLGS